MPIASTSPRTRRLSRSRRLWAIVGFVGILAPVFALGMAPSASAAGDEWNIARVKAPRSASGVVVAVVDTGVDPNHPALRGRVLPQIDTIGDGKKGDPHWHGTHVAGTAAGAATDNGCSDGAIGVAPDARILPVRVLDGPRDGSASGTTTDVAEGIRAAADAGAAVINLSLGSDVAIRAVSGGGGSTFRDAITYAWNKGSIPVLAAGNDGIAGALLGSRYGGLKAVVVTATDNQDRVAGYATSIGDADWGIAAPGGDASGQAGRDVLSAYPDARCAVAAGTSMATPHVAGALAVLRARGLTKQQAVDRILSTARDLGPRGVDGTYGHGLLDLGAALAGLGGGSPTTVPAAPTTVTGGSPATTVAPSAPVTTSGGGVPATQPRSSTSSPAPDTSPDTTVDDPGDAPDETTTTSRSSDGDEVAVDTADPGRPDAGGNGPGAAVATVAIVACGAAWAFTGRAALAARR